ncbi:hypothetical protein Aperf_G00000023113 [Anoplocephala perfoliata]
MYMETLFLLNLIKSYQSFDGAGDKSKILDKSRNLLSLMESQVGFLSRSRSETSIDAIKLSISCMKSRRTMGGWPKYHTKINSAVRQLVSVYMPSHEDYQVKGTCSGSVPFGVLFTQLEEFAVHKNAATHPSTWLDDDVIRSRLADISSKYRKRSEEECLIGDDGNLISSWISSLSSFDRSESGVASASSIAVQTDETLGMFACLQSTPNEKNNPNVKYLLPKGRNLFISDLDSLPDPPPEVDQSKSKPNGNINLSLTDDQETTIRRRKPWTLSETLALWHEVQQALPNPPSWAKIRDKVFASSRRTNVDLKDRWRVIQRDKALQKEIRLYYDKWLAGRNKPPSN